MAKVHTEMCGKAHAYTGSEVPWSLATARSGCGRMIDYISGGGMRTFGRTIRQEETRRKHRRFLVVSAILALAWFLLLVF